MLAFKGGEVMHRIIAPSELGLRSGAPNKFSIERRRFQNYSQYETGTLQISVRAPMARVSSYVIKCYSIFQPLANFRRLFKLYKSFKKIKINTDFVQQIQEFVFEINKCYCILCQIITLLYN